MNRLLAGLLSAGIFLLIYVYVLYPVVLWVLGRFFARRIRRDESLQPTVALLICAYNEEAIIAEKLKNSLDLDYPADRLQILVASDHSSDRTDEIIQSLKDPRLVFYRSDRRVGKTALLNQMVPLTAAEILIFSDANALYQPDALHKLVRNFADPDVGYVTGCSRYMDVNASAAASSEGLYWRYEEFLKRAESRIGSMVGADGAIYAIRRKLYQPLRPGDINDFVNPLQIVLAGWRGIYESEAIGWEATSGCFHGEFRRKTRIVARCLRGLARVPGALHPLRSGWFALELISHKLLRWMIPLALIQILICSAWLAAREAAPIYGGLLLAQIAFYGLALVGHAQRARTRPIRLFYLPYYFCLINAAALLGLLRFLRGEEITVWEPQRDPALKAAHWT